MSLVIDDDIDRLAEHLAGLLRVDKIEATRVALANELRIYEASLANKADAQRPVKGSATGLENGGGAGSG